MVGKYFKGFYNEKRQREIGENEEKNRKMVARDDGIPMIYYLKPIIKSICVGKTTKKCAGMLKCKMTRGKKRRFCRTRKNKTLR
jgi:hypothetical protein